MHKKFTIILLFCLCSSFVLQAQVKDMPKSLLRFGISGDLYFLYPEAGFENNPVYLLDLEERTFFNDLYFGAGSDYSEQTHPDNWAGAGVADGKSISTNSSMTISSTVTGIFPSEKRHLGFSALLYLSSVYNTDELTDFNANPESNLTEEEDNLSIIFGSVYWASKLGSMDLGLRVGLYYYNDPYGMISITDSNTNNGDKYLSAFYSGVNETSTSMIPFSVLGTRLNLAGGVLGLGLGLSYQSDKTELYTIVDTDGNGFGDEAMTLVAQQQSSETWGGSNPDYKRLDSTEIFGSIINYSYIKPLQNDKTFILAGDITPYNSRVNQSYFRTTANDNSVSATDILTIGLNALASVEFFPHKNFTLRMGGGAKVSSVKQIANDLDGSGSSIFSSENSNHYPEETWGAGSEPSNGDIVSSVDTGTDSYDALEITPMGLVGVEWRILDNLVLFNTMNISHKLGWTNYHVFDTADNTTWSETVFANDGSFDFRLAVGAGVFLDNGTYLGFSANTNILNSDWDSTKDALPEHSGSLIQDGGANYNESGNNSFTLDVYAIIQL